ncbi:glycosyltransferase family 4 protein [Elizabethkingia anophelis]|uniref:glycosyltransferase family 4 protein n=1 Tax=Elizabethkingia anophelis TaxID=1117645 RepID=UPI002010F82C|nr:glycosyltransferase [Elizabethkingia anophelis]EJC8061659.1 glycosyltransferase [Elizabethkingia anophelis]MCL1642582.1 glycosyltransferase [Elizabethkingia anophelis]MCL1645831.1 glycosyltransferase [Elizabethkingia anophelis]MCT3927193.1 glycosyltransferase [Elizabethkingia anophelis]MCT4034786.1 glycosyltransferase [Elizabethkingia anophelis]
MEKKINILTSGRFHVLDLAKELIKEGYDVKFYSYVPPNRMRLYGLNKKNYTNLFFPLIPFLLFEKIFNRNYFFTKLKVKVLDWYCSRVMRATDVTIAMSGLFVTSLKKAKKQNNIIIVERGSKHILEQKEILENIPSLRSTIPVSDFDVNRELVSYSLADYISIASKHVEKSFFKYGDYSGKLFINPYGVDLKDFYPIKKDKKYDVIMVGNWSYQKGVDLLWKACENMNLSLLHVGAKGDSDFPDNASFTHQDPVDQRELVEYYNQSRVLCLPSRQEGLAMVQAQAIACGLPIVCSMHTGGEDLKKILCNTKNIHVMDNYTIEDLQRKILDALNTSHTEYKNLNKLSWEAYGKRYNEFLKNI